LAGCAPLRGGPCPASRFFSAVRLRRVALRVHLVRRCVLANVGPCIPLGQRLRVLVHWVWDQRFRLRELRVPALAPAAPREGRASATFRVE
jgi:hypothetical protein